MKKVIAKIISVLLKASIPIISACIGIKLCESFNLFQIFQIIADPEKAFDICMTAYIAIFDLMLHVFLFSVQTVWQLDAQDDTGKVLDERYRVIVAF